MRPSNKQEGFSVLVDDKQAREKKEYDRNTPVGDLLSRVQARRGSDQMRLLRGERPQESWPWIHETELIAMIESLSAQVANTSIAANYWREKFEAAEAQVAELKKDAERLHGLIEQLAWRFKGYLPWPDSQRDSVVRGHEMFIKDTISKADAILAAKESGVSQTDA